MPSQKSDAIKFLATTLRSVEVLGQDRTITLLNDAITNYNSDVSEVVDLMFNCVYKIFSVDKGEIIFGRSRKQGRRAEAIICAAYILAEHTEVSQSSIAKILNKDGGNLTNYKKKYNLLSDKIPSDRELKKKIEEVEKLFLERKLILNKNGKDASGKKAPSKTRNK